MNAYAAEFARHRWRYALVATLVATGFCAAVFTGGKTGRTLRVGYNDFPPYVLADEHGGPSGLAVQVVQKAAEHRGIRLTWIPVEDVEQALRTGQIDLFPILSVTAARKIGLYPSAPWWESSQSLLSLRDSPLKSPGATLGKRIAIRDQGPWNAISFGMLPGAELIPTHGSSSLIRDLCEGRVAGALLDARLIYEVLLEQPKGCAARKLLLVPLPETSLPMATFARPQVKVTAARLYDGIEEVAIEGTMTSLANRWFAMPQQRYVRERLSARQGMRLTGMFAAGLLLLVAFTLWHHRRTLRMRNVAQQAWSRAVDAERRFETFMAHTPAISFIKDSSGRIIYVNDAFVRFRGLSVAEATGRLDTEVWGAEAAPMRERDDEVLRTGQPVQYVLPLHACDGAIHHWLVLKFLLTGEPCRARIGVVAIDITDQQRAADLVASSEERYRRLFEEAPVAIHEIDRAGLVTRINRAGRVLCGYTEDEILGRHASEFVAPGNREESRVAVHAKMTGKRPLVPFERHFQHKDGRVFRAEVHESAILDETGAIQGMRSCLIDLTELHEAHERLDAFALQLQGNNAALAVALESAREATRLKGQFLANMSHEIRTPMNGVLGMTELLVQSGLTAEQRSLALTVTQSGEHLLAIINDILDFSKIEAGKFELESLPFDLTATVEAVIELMTPAAHIKHLELNYWIAPEVSPSVVGDAARLRQVMLNLLGNAIKFTETGEITIQLCMAGDCIRFAVADTGIGIPPAAIEHLFAPFTQADSTTTRRFGGTGLGLAIAKNIVDLMGGTIGVDSRDGAGSTFWFTALLPPAGTSLAPERPRLPDALILIVDDNQNCRSILERHAQSWGLRTQAAASGEEALVALRSRRFDAAIIDIQLPGMNATGLLAEIAPTPVLRLNSIGIPPEGAAFSIHKPVKPAMLYESLRRILLHAAEPPAAPPPAPAPAPVPQPLSTSRGRVLIAEDNAINQRVARLQVSHCGFEADVVANGEEALAALAQMAYTLVLMDCQMPGMDGYAATRELRRRERGARHLPVIAMTANAFAADREACLEAGMDDHLSKPVSMRNLAAVLDRWAADVHTAPVPGA